MSDLSCLRHNVILIKTQIASLQRANEMMDENWGTYTNDPGFRMADHPFMKKLLGKDYICPFETPYNGGVKPFLLDIYKAMNNEMIKELERRLEQLNENNTQKE